MRKLPEDEKEMHIDIIVKGRVQGVSFRAYTKRKAQSLAITGYVKNLSNGDVKIQAEGKKISLFDFIKWLRNEGSPASEVSEVKVDWSEKLKNYTTFGIKFY